MAEESKPKWEGKTSAELTGPAAEQVWPLLEDFCNIHKWFPMDTCYQVDGVPGLIRHCVSTAKGDAEKKIMWAKEKLLLTDPIQRYLTYEIVESNMGFKSYVATMKVLPMINGGDAKAPGCKIEWSFVCDPVQGWTYEGLFSYIESCLQSMAKKMELAFSAT